MPNARINGVDLHWQMSGDTGDPIVFVHGSWSDHGNWDRVVPALARSWRVVVYDRRGHSRSERPPGQGSVRDDVADLAALIEHLGIAPAHIVGNSFGAAIVLRLAASRPGLFKTLVVHEPPLLGLLDDRTSGNLLEAARKRTRAVLDLLEMGQMEAGARLFMETIALGPGAWAQLPPERRDTFVRNAPTFLDEERDPESRTMDLATVTRFARPALLTHGDRSEPFFPAIVDAVARALPGASRSTLHGIGHVPHVTHPDEYVRMVESFVRGAGRTGV